MIDRETLFRTAVESKPAFVFESDPDMAAACRILIRGLQIEVDVTGDREVALRLAKEKEYCFALIRLMPQEAYSGLDVAAAVRSRSATAHIVLISTSWPIELLAETKKLPRTVVMEVPSNAI